MDVGNAEQLHSTSSKVSKPSWQRFEFRSELFDARPALRDILFAVTIMKLEICLWNASHSFTFHVRPGK